MEHDDRRYFYPTQHRWSCSTFSYHQEGMRPASETHGTGGRAEKELVCTWMSGSSFANKKVWERGCGWASVFRILGAVGTPLVSLLLCFRIKIGTMTKYFDTIFISPWCHHCWPRGWKVVWKAKVAEVKHGQPVFPFGDGGARMPDGLVDASHRRALGGVCGPLREFLKRRVLIDRRNIGKLATYWSGKEGWYHGRWIKETSSSCLLLQGLEHSSDALLATHHCWGTLLHQRGLWLGRGHSRPQKEGEELEQEALWKPLSTVLLSEGIQSRYWFNQDTEFI